MSDPRVIGLAGVGLQVPELRVAEKFYGSFGLNAEKRKSKGLNPSSKEERPGIWFEDPWGTWINLTPGRSPYKEEAAAARSGVDVHHWQSLNRDPKPQRIGHMLM